MKRKSILVAVIAILMIGGGCIVSFATSFAKDISDIKENKEIIETHYKKFKEEIESFNGDRELLYTNVFNNLYLENVEEKYNDWISTFQNYENTLEKITKHRSVLEERCLGILYNDSNIQSRCDSMLLSYETAINYYVKDVHKLNELLELYNEQVEETYQVGLYDLKEYNYIDFNDDGKYLGK